MIVTEWCARKCSKEKFQFIYLFHSSIWFSFILCVVKITIIIMIVRLNVLNNVCENSYLRKNCPGGRLRGGFCSSFFLYVSTRWPFSNRGSYQGCCTTFRGLIFFFNPKNKYLCIYIFLNQDLLTERSENMCSWIIIFETNSTVLCNNNKKKRVFHCPLLELAGR